MIDLLAHVHRALRARKDEQKPLRPADRVALFRRVFGTEDGERVLTELAVFAGVFTTIHPAEGDVILQRAEAKRELFYDIARELTAVAKENGEATYIHDHTRIS